MERVEYDEFGLFHENAEEFGLPYDGPPTVRREFVELPDGRKISALVWGTEDPEYVFLHGGAQNAHTWDTVAMAIDRPLVAIDLPGHGHSDGPNEATGGQIAPQSLATDVAVAIRKLAPNARGVIGMSLGGLTTIALTAVAPELVRSVVLVDVTPGVDGEKSKVIADFINGPPSFPSFDDLLARTIEYNPTRTESSLRRGILHNAVQLDDGSWVWRYARFRPPPAEGQAPATGDSTANFPRFSVLWDAVAQIKVPLMLARGMREQSVVDDADEVKLLEVLPDARVEHVAEAGHSLQGDTPIELAQLVVDFVPTRLAFSVMSVSKSPRETAPPARPPRDIEAPLREWSIGADGTAEPGAHHRGCARSREACGIRPPHDASARRRARCHPDGRVLLRVEQRPAPRTGCRRGGVRREVASTRPAVGRSSSSSPRSISSSGSPPTPGSARSCWSGHSPPPCDRTTRTVSRSFAVPDSTSTTPSLPMPPTTRSCSGSWAWSIASARSSARRPAEPTTMRSSPTPSTHDFIEFGLDILIDGIRARTR